MNALAWSLIAIAVAPLLERLTARWPALASATDALAAIVVLATVLLHTLPYALGELGGIAVLIAAAGLLVPPLCEVSSPRLLGTVVVAGLGAHALVDGALLAAPDEQEAGHVLAEAIAVHTVPVSLAIWRAALPHGLRVGVGLLGLTAVAELVGWFGARNLLDHSGGLLALLQCFTAGTLLHFVWAPTPDSPRGSALGAVAGLAIASAMTLTHPIPASALGEMAVLPAFLGLCEAAAPALLGGLLLTGLLPRARRGPAAALGVAALAAMLAGALLGLPLGLAAAASGLLALRRGRRAPSTEATLSLDGLRREVDGVLGWALLGLGAGALLEPLLAADALSGGLGLVAVGVTGALGLLAPTSVAGLVPLAAVLEHKGLMPGGVLVLLWAPAVGAALDLDALAEVKGRVYAVRAGLLAGAGLLGLGGLAGATAPGLRGAPLHPLLMEEAGPAAWLGLGLAGLLALDALWRLGLPGLLPPILRGHHHPGGEHDHSHHHHLVSPAPPAAP